MGKVREHIFFFGIGWPVSAVHVCVFAHGIGWNAFRVGGTIDAVDDGLAGLWQTKQIVAVG
jgi:hypothetical protein